MFRKLSKRFMAVVLACVMIFGLFGSSVQATESTNTSGAELTIDGKPNAAIVIPENASDNEKLALEELQEHMELVSGTRLPTAGGTFSGETFSVEASPSNLITVDSGEYPITVSLYNPTNSDKVITLVQEGAKEGMPKAILRGDDGQPGVTVSVKAGEKVIVSGILNVVDASAFYSYDVNICAMEGTNVLAKTKIQLVANRSMLGDLSFENDMGDWIGGKRDTSVGYKSGASLKVGASAKLALAMNNAGLYYIGFWAKGASNNSKLTVKLQDVDKDGAAIAGPLTVKSDIALGTDWQYYEYRVIANPYANANYSSAVLELIGGDAWIDNFVVVDCGTASNELSAVMGGFEYDPSLQLNVNDMRWYTWNNDWKPVTTDKFTGEQSFKIVAAKNKEAKLRWTYGMIKNGANKAHTISFWAKAETEGTPLTVKLHVRNSNTYYEKSFTLSTEWLRYEFSCITPGIGSLGVHPYFVIPKDADASGDRVVYLDNVVLADTQKAQELAVPKTQDETTSSTTDDEIIAKLAAPARPKYIIFIGTTETMPELKTKFADDVTYLATTQVSETEVYASDGFAIRQEGDNIYIFGNESRGALNGVYDFIEENLGVMWIRATETLYDEMKTVRASKVDYREKSPFSVRGWNTPGAGNTGLHTCDEDTDRMFSRNKFNFKYVPLQPTSNAFAKVANIQRPMGLDSFYASHNVVSWLRSSPIFDPNEAEYWNRDEEGILYNAPEDDRYQQVNFWSEKTINAVAQSMISLLDSNPGLTNIGIGVTDTTTFAQYPEQTIPFEYAPGKFAQPTNPRYNSTVYYTFLNKIIAIVKEKYPDIILNTFSYNFVELDPLCDIDDSIRILYAPAQEDMTDPINTTEKSNNNKIFQNLERMKQKTTDIVVYTYYGCATSDYYYPRPIISRIQEDLLYFASCGFSGVMPEGSPDYGDNTKDWNMNGLSYWIYGKLAWDPYADVEELVKYYCDRVYGDASEVMYQFYKTIEKGWEENKQEMNVTFYTSLSAYLQKFVIGAGISDTVMQQLDEAYNLGDDKVKARIQYMRESFKSIMEVVASLESEEAIATYTSAGKDKILQTFDMSDPIWADAVVLKNFYKFTAEGPFTIEGIDTHLRLMWDTQYLYVAYENFDPGIDDIVLAPYLNAEGTWWVSGGEHNSRSDHYETWLTTDPGQRFYVYFGTPKGLHFRYYNDTTNTFDPTEVDWDCTGTVMEDRSVVIKAISFESLGLTGGASVTSEIYGSFDRAYYEIAEGSAQYLGWNGAPSSDRGYLTRIQLVKNGSSDSNIPGFSGDAGDLTVLTAVLIGELVLIAGVAALAVIFAMKKKALDAKK